ncbi:ImmA/IrrE family metallo-endopeptidase [Gordonibacter sp. Marseille-P4307]|uniref:ImmA/IrrE family metallo-endopeptidase n=1 Tax=Gordonibacter sp. Marseille-P4307 TaxID=2161815 RepID=UPI003519E599
MFYNDRQDREHIRFTVAHELAHLVLIRPDTGEDIYKHETDIFANYPLAPQPHLCCETRGSMSKPSTTTSR